MAEQYYGLVESYIVQNSGSKKDALSIVNDVWMALHRYVNKPDFEQSATLKTIIYSIARNMWLPVLRKRRNNKEIELDDKYNSIALEDKVTRKIELDEGQKMLTAMIQNLRDNCKELIRLYYFSKLKMAKIAKQLNIPNEAAAKNRKARCLKNLRAAVLDNPAYADYLKEYLHDLTQTN